VSRSAAGLAQMPRSRGKALAQVVLASVVLAPFALAARARSVVSRRWLERDDAARCLWSLGIDEAPLALTPLGGGRSNAVYRVELPSRTLVLKRALAMGTVLAVGARLAGPQPYARDVSSGARTAREARALASLAAAGIRVPKLVAAAPHAGLLVMEHIDGVPLPSTLGQPGARDRIAAYAHLLAAVHAAGIALADAHPGNVLVTPSGELVLVDLEFAEPLADLGDREFAARCRFDRAYAAAYFTPDERPWFGDVDADPRIAELDVLFTLERRRQRQAA